MHNTFILPTKLASVSAFIAGLLLVTAFAPFNWHWASVFAPALMLLTWLNGSPKQIAWRGFVFGLGFFGFGTSWVFLSIHRYGNASVWLAGVITLGFVTLLATFPALTAWLFSRFFSDDTIAKRVLVFPALWVLTESLRNVLLTGFPWLFLGYSQIDLPLAGYFPLIGIYGVSFLVCCSAGIATLVLRAKAPISLFVFLFATWLCGAYLTNLNWGQATQTTPRLSVALIQANIAQSSKWSVTRLQGILGRYVNLTQQHWDSDLIVWPESAIPAPYPFVEDTLTALGRQALAQQTALLIGIPIPSRQTGYFYNALLLLGAGQGHYYKRHLVPLGEYLPEIPLLKPLLTALAIPMASFLKGPLTQTEMILSKKSVHLAPFICYEIAYAGLFLQDFPAANLIVTSSDDSWFGDAIAAPQHLQIARVRSAEVARYQLFVTNTGPSAIITASGHLETRAPRDRVFVLRGNVPLLCGRTPWSTFGPIPLQVLLVIGLVFGMLLRRA